jgi:nucleoside-diphosphate-sugar epimerase
MTDLYLFLLEQSPQKIQKQIFNAGYQNYTVMEIANIVSRTLGGNIRIKVTPSNDLRSYHVSSKKIMQTLGFRAKHTIEEAVLDIKKAFEEGKMPNSFEDIRFYNIKTMQACSLK